MGPGYYSIVTDNFFIEDFFNRPCSTLLIELTKNFLLNHRIYTRPRTPKSTTFCKTDIKQQHIRPKLKDTKRGGPRILFHSNAQGDFNSREIPFSAIFFITHWFNKKNFFVKPENLYETYVERPCQQNSVRLTSNNNTLNQN